MIIDFNIASSYDSEFEVQQMVINLINSYSHSFYGSYHILGTITAYEDPIDLLSAHIGIDAEFLERELWLYYDEDKI